VALGLPVWGWANTAPSGAWAAPPQARSTAPPGAWSACSWVQPKHHVALGLPILLWRLVCLLLGAAQSPRGTWAAYTFSVITSIGIKNIILSFLIILFLV